MKVCLFAIALFLAEPVAAKKKVPADISVWTAADIAAFIKNEAGVSIAVDLIEKADIQGDDLFDGLLDAVVLEKQLMVTG